MGEEEKDTKVKEKKTVTETENQSTQAKQESAKEVKKEKKSKKGLIALIIILILIVIGVIVFFTVKYFNNSKSVGTTWGDTYYAYLKEGIETEDESRQDIYGIYNGVDKATLEFVEVEEKENPVMLMTYNMDNKTYTNVYYINEVNEINTIPHNETTDIMFLYNIEEQEYGWYLNLENEDTDTYLSLKDIVNNDYDDKEYIFEKAEENIEEENTISEFDETFINVEIGENKKVEVSLNKEDLNKIYDSFINLVNGWVSDEEKLTEEIKNEVNEQVQYIENAINQLGQGSIENGLIKAGEYTLQCGRYVDKYNTVYILNQDGTASCESASGNKDEFEEGEYVVYNINTYTNEIDTWEIQNGPIGFSGEWMIAIGKNIDEDRPYLTYSYSISDNNTFYDGQTDEIWTYEPEEDDEEEKEEPEEVNNNENANNETREETSSTFKVGSYTLHYGTYSGKTSQYTDDRGVVSYTLTITFKQDGTYSLKSTDQELNKDENGTYEVTNLQGMYGIQLDDGAFYMVNANDTISQPAGAGSSFTYQG